MHQFTFRALPEEDRTIESVMQIASLLQEQARLFVKFRKQSSVDILNAVAKLSQEQVELVKHLPKEERNLRNIEELLATSIATERVLFFIKSGLEKKHG